MSTRPKTAHRNTNQPQRPRTWYHSRTQRRSRTQSSRMRTESMMNFAELENLISTNDASAIIVLLNNRSDALENTLSYHKLETNKGLQQMLLRVLGKICSTSDMLENLRPILHLLKKHSFINKMNSLILGMKLESSQIQKNISDDVRNALQVLKMMMMTMPDGTHKEGNVSLLVIETVIAQCKVNCASFHAILDEVKGLLQDQDKKRLPAFSVQSKLNQRMKELHLQDAPEDFRHLSIFPQLSDLSMTTSEVFLRSNLTDGVYKSLEHYLDVQFRLLREDFMRPLREGIANIVSSDGILNRNSREVRDNLKLYEHVKIEYAKADNKGISYKIHFSTEKFHGIRWENSKRLLFGNMLCLSLDNFKNHVIFATVADRNPNDLSLGYLMVNFIKDEDDHRAQEDEHDDEDAGFKARKSSSINMDGTYVMVETEAFFESYRHVLAHLKEMRSIPLERYIVKCEGTMGRPQYLRESQRNLYDMTSITNKSEGAEAIPIFNNEKWPTNEVLGLDSSQSAALKSALTSELAVIQGPPGTGKTHVGLKIIEVLLNNSNKWQVRVRNAGRRMVSTGPIIIVCFTNHALDQFLEGIAKFWPGRKPNSIIRIGGRCSEAMKKYSLMTVKRNCRRSEDAQNSKLNVLSQQINRNANQLEASTKCIPNIEVLKPFMQPEHREQLMQATKWSQTTDENFPLLYWLGVKKMDNSCQNLVRLGLSIVVIKMLNYAGFTNEMLVEAIKEEKSSGFDHIYFWAGKKQLKVVNILPCLQQFQPENITKALKKLDHTKILSSHWESDHGQWLFNWMMDNREFIYKESDEDFYEEADFIQERRMLDSDYNYEQIMTKQQRENELKRCIANISASTFRDIANKYPHEDSQGFEQTKRDKKRQRQYLKHEIGKTSVLSNSQEKALKDIWQMNIQEKWKLLRTWVQKWRHYLRNTSVESHSEYETLCRRLHELRVREDQNVIREADIVALTTTGAARMRDVISNLNSKIMIVEEAAECLEAHIITAMPHSIEHLILIGDHQQLKPSPTVYELAKKFHLDISLFERLIGFIPYQTLEIQHRMKPDIANLIRPDIYSKLIDAENVKEYQDIKGMKKSLFFVSHEQMEDSVADGRSKSNKHESEFVVALCKYLMLQGYNATQITILVTYTGQLFEVKKEMEAKTMQGVRVTAVDNFQGEENDIIILSLVRSNEEGRIGFLSVSNRICVALSRAKLGFYCIGDFGLLKEKSRLWDSIVSKLKETYSVGEQLPLRCVNHPRIETMVQYLGDFSRVPEGGCSLPCAARLECGHACPRFCHPEDHSDYKCKQQCEKMCKADLHKCKRTCYLPCVCNVRVPKIIPLCGHEQQVPCDIQPADYKCQKDCIKILPCDHACENKCGYDCTVNCLTKVKVTLMCGHVNNIACYKAINTLEKYCEKKCEEVLECGHKCPGSCAKCLQGRLHLPCAEPCNRVLICWHKCQSTCSEMCPPCMKKCPIACKHSTCQKTCGEICVPCKQKCDRKCKHSKCTMLCGEPCNKPVCNEPCDKKLKCGHSCIGLCGETCPKFCRVCDKEKVTEIFFGDEDEEEAKFIQLGNCAHIFTYESLDTWMEQSNEGHIEFKVCPRCKEPITKSDRYRKHINMSITNVNAVKKKAGGSVAAKKLCLQSLTKLVQLKSNVANGGVNRLSCELKKHGNTNSIAVHQLAVFESKIHKAKFMDECTIKQRQIQKANQDPQKDISRLIEHILTWILKPREQFSNKEDDEFLKFQNFLIVALEVLQLRPVTILSSREKVNNLLEDVEKMMFEDFEPFVGSKEENVKNMLDEAKKLVGYIPKMGITVVEKDSIVKAMGHSQGHWYTCPNGHVYVIGDCGGATQTSKCPECNEDIGGSSHQLLSTNRVATEMDGATRSAYDPRNEYIPPEAFN